MIGAASFATAAMAVLVGHFRALTLLDEIGQGIAHPDALARAAEALAADPDALRGLFRAVQKSLEFSSAQRGAR